MDVPVISGLFKIGNKLIDSWFPDPEEADKRRADLAMMIQNGEMQKLDIVASIIKSEAGSEHWLTANWRPLTMLTFVALIVAHWLGFTAENLTDEVVIMLLEIVKVGLGGYVIGRSVEKGIKEWKAKPD